MGWSERFAKYLKKRGLNQQDAMVEMRASGVRVTQSQVHYWTQGALPRESTRMRIEEWSKGAVPAASPKSEPRCA